MGNFDAPRYPDAPGHRGVGTSVAAAEDLRDKLGRLQTLVLGAIRNAGSNGLTADEASDTLGIERWSIQPRTSELRRKLLIGDSGQRRRNRTGKLAIVWVAAEHLDQPCRAEAA